jgi:23S rRNA (cytidine2498-2'-O)-methyltransferase
MQTPATQLPLDHLLLFCRAGFEADLAAECVELWPAERVASVAGTVALKYASVSAAGLAYAALELRELVFARQAVWTGARLALGRKDRIAVLKNALGTAVVQAEAWFELPDSEAGKAMAGLARGLQRPFDQALQAHSVQGDWRVSVVLEDGEHAWLGLALPERAAMTPGGIPRLKFPADAPSRSTLKLDEALLYLADERTRQDCLQPGHSAVDLGAAPGGWTYQLLRRGLKVIAIDNGPMSPKLQRWLNPPASLSHLRVDGLRYKPKQPVHLVVCDMVIAPQKTAQVMAEWIQGGHAKTAIFNLKLPMKQRLAAIQAARKSIAEQLGSTHQLVIKQLYHDRDEVTCLLRRTRSKG